MPTKEAINRAALQDKMREELRMLRQENARLREELRQGQEECAHSLQSMEAYNDSLLEENARLKEELKAAQAGGWVSVEERLPEEGQIVNVLIDGRPGIGKKGEVDTEFYVIGMGFVYTETTLRRWTHSAELPPLPGEE